jgi:hypothetical protein
MFVKNLSKMFVKNLSIICPFAQIVRGRRRRRRRRLVAHITPTEMGRISNGGFKCMLLIFRLKTTSRCPKKKNHEVFIEM